MVPFAGWEMPVQYRGVIDEHRAVRSAAGIFDVSHMGEFLLRGPGAEAFLQSMTPNDVAKLAPGRAHYSGLLNAEGGYLDDLLIYRLAPEEFLIVVNAANAEPDFAWLAAQPRSGSTLEDASERWALIAAQGPKAAQWVAPLVDADLDGLAYYAVTRANLLGQPGIVARTGYTGEDGFELFVAPEDAERLWDALLEAGAQPAGLGARDTLRLEAGMALYGHELDATTTPWQAGLGWVVKLGKGDFFGRSALVREREGGGPARRLVGLELEGRGIAREGHPILVAGEVAGRVTSGTWSPTFEKAIAMGYVPAPNSAPGSRCAVDVRGRAVDAAVVPLPFYKRSR
jgi:aminomethyltransferase